jgi:hypothetical protein
MATLTTLVEQRQLVRVTVPLRRNQFHDRILYAFPQCVEWMRNDVGKLTTGRLQSDRTPLEQLHSRLREWMADEPMRLGTMFSRMRPRTDYVCELKTDDLRIFGWMYQPKKFIAVFGDYADDYKIPTQIKSYDDAVRKVVEARANLPLDGDKFVKGNLDEHV